MLPYVNDSREGNENEERFDYEKTKKIAWYHHVLLNRPAKVVITLLLIALIAPPLIYYYLLYLNKDPPPSDGVCLVPRTARLLCGLGHVNSHECHPECCFDSNSTCFHMFPSRFSYLTDVPWNEHVSWRPRIQTVPFRNQNSVSNLRISIDDVTPTHLSLTFFNPEERELNSIRLTDKDYNYSVTSPLNVVVNRADGNIIFNTRRGPFIAADNIWEIAFRLTEESMYGLGEIPLVQDTVKIIYSHNQGLSSVPLIFAKSNGSYHGLLIDIKEPTEVRIQDENQIVVRSITKQGLKFHIFVGPHPKDIMRDLMSLIKYNKGLEYWMLGAHVCSDVSQTPTEAFSALSDFIGDATRENLPFESHCGTSPVVFDDDFCEKEKYDYIERGAALVINARKRFIPHLSPYIQIHPTENNNSSEEATVDPLSEETETTSEEINTDSTTSENTMPEINTEEDITELPTLETTDEDNTEETIEIEPCSILQDFEELMLQNPLLRPYEGSIGEDMNVIYPDYANVNATFVKKLWRSDVELDGLVLENSWPRDDSEKYHPFTYQTLPYFNEHFEHAFENTPPWYIDRPKPNGDKYIYSHNEYGNNFANAFKKSYDDIPIYSTSHWMNGDIIVNRQNVNASWANLQSELVEAALGGISGHRLWSSPVCGDTEHFDDTTQVNLCVKWYMAATYLPMLKIHSKSISRHPLSFTGTDRIRMITALNHRLSLLPYFYTTLQQGPLLRPMFYQFPYSEELLDLKTQFCVGEDLLIVPNLQPSQSHVHVWVPAPCTWYEFWSGLPLDGEEGQPVTMATTEADFLTLIRGGSIVVTQRDVKPTAVATRHQSDFTLTIALECETVNTTDNVTATNCNAHGSLYMTESMTLIFDADSEKLTITANGSDFKAFCEETEEELNIRTNAESKWANKVNDINIYGLDDKFNNYDNHRHIQESIELCNLKNNDESIVVPLID